MQDFDTSQNETDEANSGNPRIEMMREYLRLIAKRMLAFIAFGPGVLGFLWLIGRILRGKR